MNKIRDLLNIVDNNEPNTDCDQTADVAIEPTLDNMVPPLQQEIELAKKDQDVPNVFDNVESEEHEKIQQIVQLILSTLKGNHG
mgnify:CR=1 FL=1